MENHQIADQFSLLSKLMDIHGENAFKSKSYAAAAFSIEKLTQPLHSLSTEQIATQKGIGISAAQKIREILDTGKLSALEQIIQATPAGILEMMKIKGIGPKKISTIWKEMEIENLGELEYACLENRLKRFKGFGEKTQQNVLESIRFYKQSKGRFLYAELEALLPVLLDLMRSFFPNCKVEATGEFARQLEIIDTIALLIVGDKNQMALNLKSMPTDTSEKISDAHYVLQTPLEIGVHIHLCDESEYIDTSIKRSCTESFWEALQNIHSTETPPIDAKDFFSKKQLPFIPPFLREDPELLKNIDSFHIENIIQKEDIKGIIHSHSTWSDGSHTIEEMAEAAISSGYEYLVISDHSQSAFYAQGLSIERVLEQHKLIDTLNEKYKPFKIFKSIESDILNDGKLDYPDEILSKFDLVIASVHSNLKMNEEKSMLRLLTAVKNPYTTILGHPTGRLLLSRPGYPIDLESLTDACAKHNVAIELNAHPRRLDLDWRFIETAKRKDILISIDPDAHMIEGFDDIKYGVKVAQKAGLKKEENLSSFSLEEMLAFLEKQKGKR
jgi:DNA polymerase (family 10)